ncbi:unnamed protein product [Larinioides sclopetarius]|uniref:Centriolar satellite-associated tubulin polyglutamylase complex regulator 1 n=1 Tax=Larinioides sclopetarius TaxID=280406 RepID=A0AAV1Z2G6_9ARAC
MDVDDMDNDNLCISTLFKTDDDSMDNDNIDISVLFKMYDDSINFDCMDDDNMDISILFKTDDENSMDFDCMDDDNIDISFLFKTDDENSMDFDCMDDDNIDISFLFKTDDENSMDDDNRDISILFKTDDDCMDSDSIDISILFKMNDNSIDKDEMDISTVCKIDNNSMHNDNMSDIIKRYDLKDEKDTREILNILKMIADNNGMDLISFIEMVKAMSDDESTDEYSIDCKAAALACENKHYLVKHKASMDNYTTDKDTTDDDTIDYENKDNKVASLLCKNRYYLEKHKIYAYLDDAVAQFISFNSRNEATQIKPAEFLKEYFGSVYKGTHVLFREYSFVSASLYNRLCVLKGIFDIYKPLCYKDDKLNAKEYHSLLQLLWPNFPFDVVQASFRSFETPEQHGEIRISFLEFFRAFKSSFCIGRFDYEENVINKDIEKDIDRVVTLKEKTPAAVLEAYFLHTVKKGRNQKAIAASVISNLDPEFTSMMGFDRIDEPPKVLYSFSGLRLPLKSKKKATTLSKTVSTSHQIKNNAKQLPSSHCLSQTKKTNAKKNISSGEQGLKNVETVKGTRTIASKSKQNVTSASQMAITNSKKQMDVKQLPYKHRLSQIKKPHTNSISSTGIRRLKSAETDKVDGGKKSLISSSVKGASKTQPAVAASSKTSFPCRKGKFTEEEFPRPPSSPVTLIQIDRVFSRLLAILEESNKESAKKLSSAKSTSKSLINLNTFSLTPSANFWGQVRVKKSSKSLMNIPLLPTEELNAKNNLSSCQQKLEISKIEMETSESKQNPIIPSKLSSIYRQGQVSAKQFPNSQGSLQTRKFVTKSNAPTVRQKSEIPNIKTEKKISSVSSRANDISKSKPNVTTISKRMPTNYPGKLGVKQLPKRISSSVIPLQTKKKLIRKLSIQETSNQPAEKTQRRLFSVAKGASKSESSLSTFYQTSSPSFGVSVRQISKSLDNLNVLQTQKLDPEKKSLICQQISGTVERKTEKKVSFVSSAAEDTSASKQNLTVSSKTSFVCQQKQACIKQLPNVHHRLQTKKPAERQRSETTKMKSEKERFFVSTVVKDTFKSKQNVINFSTKSSAEKQNHLQTKKSAESQLTFRRISETTKTKQDKERFFVSTVVKEPSKYEQNANNFSAIASAKTPGQVNVKCLTNNHYFPPTVKNYADKNSSADTQRMKHLKTVKIGTKDYSKSKQSLTTFSKTRSTSHRKLYKAKVINVAEQLGWTQLETNNFQKNNISAVRQRSVAVKMETEKSRTPKYFPKLNVDKYPYVQRSRAFYEKLKTEKKVTFVDSEKQNESNISKMPSTSNQEPLKVNVVNVAEQLGWTQSGVNKDPVNNASTFRQGPIAAKIKSGTPKYFPKLNVDKYPYVQRSRYFYEKLKTEKKTSSGASKDASIFKQNESTISEMPSTNNQEPVKINVINIAEHLSWTQSEAGKDPKNDASAFKQRPVSVKMKSENLEANKYFTKVNSNKHTFIDGALDCSSKVRIHQDAEKHFSVGSKRLKTGETIETKTEKKIPIASSEIKETTFSETSSTNQQNADKNSSLGNQGLKTRATIETKAGKKLSIAPPVIKVTSSTKAPSSNHQEAEKNSFGNQGLKPRETVKAKTEKRLAVACPAMQVTPLSKTPSISHQNAEKKSLAGSQGSKARETVKTKTVKIPSLASPAIKVRPLSKKLSVREPYKVNVINVGEQLGWTQTEANKSSPKSDVSNIRQRSEIAKMKTERKVSFTSSSAKGTRNMIETEKKVAFGSSGTDVSKCKQKVKPFVETTCSTDLDSLIMQACKNNDELVDILQLPSLKRIFPKKTDPGNNSSKARKRSQTSTGAKNNMTETEKKVAVDSSKAELDALLMQAFKNNDELVDILQIPGLKRIFPKKPDVKNNSSTARQRSQTVKIKGERNTSFDTEVKDTSKQSITSLSEMPSTSHEEPLKINVINVAEQLGWTQLGANKDANNSASTFRPRSVTTKIKAEKPGTPKYYPKINVDKYPYVQRSRAFYEKLKTEKKVTSVASGTSTDVSKFKKNESTISEIPSTSNQGPLKINVINVAEQLGWIQSEADKDPKINVSTCKQRSEAADMKREKQ